MVLIILRLAIILVILYAIFRVARAMMAMKSGRRIRQIADQRGNLDGWLHFHADFPEVPEDRLRDVYTGLRNLVPVPDFPLLPDDILYDLEIPESEIKPLIAGLIAKHGGNYAEAEKKLYGRPIQTARDVVNWIGTATRVEEIKEETDDGPR